ncbi:hypothetical protein BD310DRAFT_855832 [Dichomitus squalens]|uniref:Mid2 domain-containing protein n=1 Tax=Dichomitus squalens TaxID=114155 RepID=A0A4Q9PP38_9APHY|nr:hypothetical protein BD310DRAFT_855832 [Dichomitus squalens]
MRLFSGREMASGRYGFLSLLFISSTFLSAASSLRVTSVGPFAQCDPTEITWEVDQSSPPFTLLVGSPSDPSQSFLRADGLGGTSAVFTINITTGTRATIVLENDDGILAQIPDLVVQAGTESSCADSVEGGPNTEAASTGLSLPGFTSATSTFSPSTSAASHTSTATISSTPGSTSPAISSISNAPTNSGSITASSSTTPKSVLPSSVSSLPSASSVSTSSGKALRPAVIGGIVTCSILALALGLGLLFWCRRRRLNQPERRFTKLGPLEPRESSFIQSARNSSITTPELGLFSTVMREDDQHSVVVTLGLPTAEAIMEHRNKPLPMPETAYLKSSAYPASSPGAGTSQEVNSARDLTLTALTVVESPRSFVGRRQRLGRSDVFDDTSSDVPSTAPPPYDQYY